MIWIFSEYSTTLYDTILYYTILYYTILYYTILYYTIPYHVIEGEGYGHGNLNWPRRGAGFVGMRGLGGSVDMRQVQNCYYDHRGTSEPLERGFWGSCFL